jgi:hypothetical protein
MKIEHPRLEAMGDRMRVTATISWEDTDRPRQEIYFETDKQFAEGLSSNPHSFLVGGLLPAMRHGEQRISVDGEICPELRDGLMTAMSYISHWYGAGRRPVRIDAKTSPMPLKPRIPERAGLFFSGGIDSLATLRINRLNFPLGHPGSIKDGLLIYGFEVEQTEAFEHVLASLTEIAQDAGTTLIPVYTNIRHLDTDWIFYRDEFQGAALSAVAHALSQRFTVVSIAATFDVPNLGPWGSHPLLDPNYSSSDLRIRHEGVVLSRLAKTKVVADWEVAFQNVRVCNKIESYRRGMLNCGRCEKCIRTMLALIALGVLNRTRAFPLDDVSESVARSVWINDVYEESCYRELLVPLAEKGRGDLVNGVNRAIDRHHRKVDWKTRIARVDRTYLKGNLSRLKRSILP